VNIFHWFPVVAFIIMSWRRDSSQDVEVNREQALGLRYGDE